MKNQKGFSLIELLVVVIIIGIIAAIAIPSLLSSRRAANEANAVASTRTIISANATYQATLGGSTQAYAPNLAALSTAGLIDSALAGATAAANAKSTYVYTYAIGATPTSYTMTIQSTDPTNQKSYFADESGVIRWAAAGAAAMASATSTPL